MSWGTELWVSYTALLVFYSICFETGRFIETKTKEELMFLFQMTPILFSPIRKTPPTR